MTQRNYHDIGGRSLQPNEFYVAQAYGVNCGPRPVRVRSGLFHRFYTDAEGIPHYLGTTAVADITHHFIKPQFPERFLPDIDDPSVSSRLPRTVVQRCKEVLSAS